MASLRLLERLGAARARACFDVTVVGAEPAPAYNRVLLSSLLAQEVEESDCRFRERPWYLRQGMRLITGAAATAIDLEEREVVVGELTTLPFDRSVLATGSDPIRLPKPGMDLPGVDHLPRPRRRGGDPRCGARAAPAPSSSAAGLLGIEAAYGLARLGVETTLLHVMDRLMERQLDRRAAVLVKAAIELKGIRVLLEADTAAIDGVDRVEAVRLADGRVLPADLVVVAVGVRPAAELARNMRGWRCGAASWSMTRSRPRRPTSTPWASAPSTAAPRTASSSPPTSRRTCLRGGSAARIRAMPAASLRRASRSRACRCSPPALSRTRRTRSRSSSRTRRRAPTASSRSATSRLVGAVLVGDVAEGPWYCDLIRSGALVSPFRNHLMFGRPSQPPEPARRLAA